MAPEEKFEALLIEEAEGKHQARLATLTLSDLPDHDVLVEVSYSTLNYKDGLAVTGKGRIARRLPMVAGIDLAGTVVESASPEWKPGDKVVVNGWGLSETEWGGYSRYQRVRPEWLIRLPEAFTLEQAMAIGTAGYTAALCVEALEKWGLPEGREVLVTGAAGGVGSVAVALLSARGHKVVASTGREETHGYLRDLGASDFVPRDALNQPGRSLQKERWGGAVDTVGSRILANVLAQTAYGGAVAACGLAAGADLPASVLPHILRSVALLGVGSVMAPMTKRARAWALLAESLPHAHLGQMTQVEPLSRVPELAEEILAGRIRGRLVIKIA